MGQARVNFGLAVTIDSNAPHFALDTMPWRAFIEMLSGHIHIRFQCEIESLP